MPPPRSSVTPLRAKAAIAGWKRGRSWSPPLPFITLKGLPAFPLLGGPGPTWRPASTVALYKNWSV